MQTSNNSWNINRPPAVDYWHTVHSFANEIQQSFQLCGSTSCITYYQIVTVTIYLPTLYWVPVVLAECASNTILKKIMINILYS